ncbi:MAG: hypothetical protein FJY97_03290 [candidate division Zixibacteria bacterium]|nr:hypothetical protein [candidate division Zixibacteria bacterium]
MIRPSFFLVILYTLAILCPIGGPVFAQTSYRPDDWESYSTHRFVSSIAVGLRYVYFATSGGVGRYDLIKETWIAPITTGDGLPDHQVDAVALDRLFGDLWCATPRGVGRYNETSLGWTIYTSGAGKSLTDVRSIGVTEAGQVLFDTGMGMVAFDLRTYRWLSEEDGLWRKISPAEIRWYGELDRKTYTYPRFRTDHDYFFDPPKSIGSRYDTYPVSSFEEDRNGRVWIGTWGLNVGKASLRSWAMSMERVGLYNRNVRVITADGDNLWFGGEPDRYGMLPSRFPLHIGPARENGGITRYNRKTGEWTYFLPYETEGLTTGDVRAIAADSRQVWIGTDAGVAVFDKTEDVWTSVPIQGMTSTDVTCLALTSTDVWIGTTAGVNRLDRPTRSITPVAIAELRRTRVYDIATDDRKAIWVATDRGVYQRSSSGTWGKIEVPDSVGLGTPSLNIESDGPMLWFSGGSSLTVYDRNTGVWKPFLLPLAVGNSIGSLRISERWAWIGGTSGAARFDRKKETWRTFTRRDGLIDDTVQSALPDGDSVWFGTPQGVTRFFWNDPARER